LSLGGDTVSGFASTVTSAPASRPNAAPISSRSAPSSGGGSSVGVPPPKNTVETAGAPGPRTRRASRTSASAARTYAAMSSPPSPGTTRLKSQ